MCLGMCLGMCWSLELSCMKAHLGEFFLDALSSGLVTPLLACTCVGLLLASVPNEGTTASSAGQGLETGPQLGIYL